MQKSNIHIRNNRRMLISNNFTALERAKANVLNNHKDGYWAAATYQILFINQIVYGEMVELKQELINAKLYKFNNKRLFDRCESAMTEYNKMFWKLLGSNDSFFSDAEDFVTEKVKNDMDILYYSVLSEVERHEIPYSKAVCRSILLNIYIDLSNSTNDLYRANFKKISGYDYDNLEYLKLTKLSVHADNLCCSLIGNAVIDLNTNKNITDSYKIFRSKILDAELTKKAINK